MQAEKFYFPNLDGIRAFACLSVFVAHAFDYINGRHFTNPAEAWLYKYEINGAGPMGVSLFFVLSGFLISYLLISEKEKSGTISFRNFYLKRVLRIWPMFFAVVIFGFFIIPFLTGHFSPAGIKQHLGYFFFFGNNIDRIKTGFTGFGNDTLGILWSVAVEEQFYLFWPLIILLSGKKLLPYLMVLLVIFSFAFRYYYRGTTGILLYHSFSVAGDLSLGGLIAWLGFYKQEFRTLFDKPAVKIPGYLFLLLVLICHNILLSGGAWAAPGRLLLTLGFGFLLADQSFSTKNKLPVSRFKNLSRLGWISYGFYCIHLFIIMVFQKINAHFGIHEITALVFYAEFALIFGVTLFLSFLSYRYFEGFFLKMKNKLPGHST